MPIGVQLLVVWVDDPSLYARLLWAAQRDPLTATAAVQLLTLDDRAHVLTDSTAVVAADKPVQVRREWNSNAVQFVAVPGNDGAYRVLAPIAPNLVLTLGLTGDELALHLAVADPALAVDPSLPSTAEWDFTVDIAGDVVPIAPAPHVLALVWPTPVADAGELEGLIASRAEAAADLTLGFEVATPRQRRATVDELLELIR